MLRGICGVKREVVKGEWRKLHNEQLNEMYSSSNNVRVIKSRMGWAGHVDLMEVRRGVDRILMGNLSERDRLEDPDVDGGKILSLYFRKWNVTIRTGSNWLRIGTGGGQ